MRRISLFFLLPLFCILVSPAGSQTAQSQQDTSSPASQTPDSKQGQPGQSSAKPASQSTQQKVWTNEDMGDLRDRSAISTVGNAHPAKPSLNQKADPNATARNAKWYRDQILKLQAKLPSLDASIQQLQDALSGKTVESVRKIWGVGADDWRDQLARLQKQRDAIQAKILALEDEARHNGVPQNALP